MKGSVHERYLRQPKTIYDLHFIRRIGGYLGKLWRGRLTQKSNFAIVEKVGVGNKCRNQATCPPPLQCR